MKIRTEGFARACALALVLVAPVAAFAQSSPAVHGHYYTRALSAVTLTAEQKKRIDTIIAGYRAAHPDSAPHDAKAEAAFHQQIATVLTPEQRARVQAEVVKLRAAGMHKSGTR